MSAPDVLALTSLCEVLAHPTRAGVLLRLRQGPAYPSDLAGHVGASRPALSHHLGVLRAHELVVAHPDGRRLRYELCSPDVARTVDLMVSLTTDPAPR